MKEKRWRGERKKRGGDRIALANSRVCHQSFCTGRVRVESRDAEARAAGEKTLSMVAE